MDIFIQFVNVAFLLPLLTWVLVDLLKKRRNFGGNEHLKYELTQKKFTVFTVITVICNVTICISYMGFCFYEYWKLNTIPSKFSFPAITWFVATIVVVYSKKQTSREDKKWPLVLILWWVFSTVSSSFSVYVYIDAHLKSKSMPYFVGEANCVDVVTFPLSMLLCFNALPLNCGRKYNDLKHPLLEKEEDSLCNDVDAFANAGIWSQLTFQWLNPLFRAGRLQKLELVHIPLVPQSETANKASSLLEESLRKQKREASSFPKALFHAIWRPLAVNAVFAGVNTIASYIGPFLITNFVNFLSNKSENSSYRSGLVLAFIFFFAKTVESLSQRQWYFGAQRVGIRIRAALMALIYKKSLSIKYAGPNNGKIINFINVDVERIGDFCLYIHGIWLLPIQVFLALIILYRNLGAAPSIAALFSTILVMVSNTPLANMQERLHSKIMEAKDSRIKATSETLKSMRVLKLHSWESTFLKRIFQLRETERSWLKRYLYTCSAVAFLFWASPTLVSVITFGVCILFRTPLTSGSVLSALATFRILQEPIYSLPELISMIAQTKVSVDRVQQFIKEEEQMKLIPYHTSKSSATVVEIETGEYAWETDGQNLKKPTIKITEKLKFRKGYKVAICGSVGSGKSSFLCSILGEIPRISGSVMKVYGSKAYVPQSAWMQTGTVRDNILFGKEMNRGFYENVLEACALNRDIEMWVDGDLSAVEERGMNLSGGQKQRIQLARAVYSDSDVYFLDDPFSAVDAHTGAHLFKTCLMHLLAQKTVIYVTHQLEFLDASDLVLVMKDGKIVQSGKYEDLIADPKGELVSQMAAHHKSLNQVNQPQEHNFVIRTHHPKNQIEVTEEKCEDGKLLERTHEEETETGRVKWHVYSTLITSAYKGALVPVILLCQILFQGLQMGSNYWIAWATDQEGKVSREKMIGIFVLMSGGSSLFILGRAVLLTTIAIETAQCLFHGMITSVFQAPISFFDSTPSSRILNRASTDQSIVDTDIPYRLAGLAFSLIQLFSIIILVSQVAWQAFPLFLVILAISIWYQAYYITTARELARMVGIRKAPILHHFSESITGAATIRCFKQEECFFRKSLSLIDDYSRIAFHNSATMEWLCVRINFLFNLVFFLILIILVSLPRSAIDPRASDLEILNPNFHQSHCTGKHISSHNLHANKQNMYENNPDAKYVGALSIGVPGEIAGLHDAWLRHGRLAWSTLFQPAIKLSKDGFVVAPYLELAINGKKELILNDPGLQKVYAPNGKLLQAGDKCYNVELSYTLESIAEQGPQAFYNGTIGQKLVKDVREAGGILTMEDLRNYKVEITDAVAINAMGYTVFGMPPPSSGTLGLSLVLNILDSYDNSDAAKGSLGLHRLIEALKHMLAIRMDLGDPSFVNITTTISDMLSTSYAKQLQQKIFDNTTFPPEYYMLKWSQLRDHGTSHFCIVDADRNAVSMTTTVNYGFGAGLLSPSTGIVLNNEMDDFSTPTEISPDTLPPSPANFIEPNKRPLSSMTPIIVTKDNQLAGVLGGSGGLYIIPAVIQVFLNHFIAGMEPLAAVQKPRVYHKLIPNVVLYENWTVIDGNHIELPQERKIFLKERGHELKGRAGGAICQLVVQTLEKSINMGRKHGKDYNDQIFLGTLTAVSDPRKDGRPAAV